MLRARGDAPLALTASGSSPGADVGVHTRARGHHACTYVVQGAPQVHTRVPCMHIHMAVLCECTYMRQRVPCLHRSGSDPYGHVHPCMHTHICAHIQQHSLSTRTHTRVLTHTHAAAGCHRLCPFAAPAPAFIAPAPCSRASVSPFERARGFSSGPEAARGWILPRDSQPRLIIHLLLARSPSWGHSSRLLPRTRGPRLAVRPRAAPRGTAVSFIPGQQGWGTAAGLLGTSCFPPAQHRLRREGDPELTP